MNLEEWIDADRLSRDDLLNVYLIGSRAHGTAHAGSDHDIVAVMRPHARRWLGMRWLVAEGWVPADPPRYRGARRDFIGKPDHQVWIFQTATFLAMRDAHVLLALECLSLPPANVWLAREDLRAGFTVDRRRLLPAILTIAGRHWTKGERAVQALAPGADPTPARKLLVHAMRALLYGAQLAEHGAIVDYAAANALRRAVLADPGLGWSDLHARFEPVLRDLRDRFERACA